MRLPEIKAELQRIRKYHEYVTERLTVLIEQIDRRKPNGRAPRRSKPITEELRQQARELYAEGKAGLTMQDVAVRLGINAGRVSEAVHGKRT